MIWWRARRDKALNDRFDSHFQLKHSALEGIGTKTQLRKVKIERLVVLQGGNRYLDALAYPQLTWLSKHDQGLIEIVAITITGSLLAFLNRKGRTHMHYY